VTFPGQELAKHYRAKTLTEKLHLKLLRAILLTGCHEYRRRKGVMLLLAAVSNWNISTSSLEKSRELIQKNIAVPFSYYEEHRCLKTASIVFVLVISLTNKLKVQPIVSRAGIFKDSLWNLT